MQIPSTVERRPRMLTLLASLFLLALWVLVTFVRPVGLGVVHLLLAAGVGLWVRWWATRRKLREQ